MVHMGDCGDVWVASVEQIMSSYYVVYFPVKAKSIVSPLEELYFQAYMPIFIQLKSFRKHI